MNEIAIPVRAPSPTSADDTILPFEVAALDVRGRVVRLGAVVDELLTRHQYPVPVAKLLGGHRTDSIPAYVSGLPGATLADKVALARDFAKRGFDAFKYAAAVSFTLAAVTAVLSSLVLFVAYRRERRR